MSVADLIGDVDVLKAAHRKLDLSDEAVIHYGIIPRTNHGIFCINELPDLSPRIQVGLLNILEEQDIQTAALRTWIGDGFYANPKIIPTADLLSHR